MSEWAAVDDLMRELGSVRHAAGLLRVKGGVNVVVEQAILDAAEAVDNTIEGPTNPQRLMAARDALGIAEEVVLALDAEIGRSLRVRARAEALRARAAVLIAQGPKLSPRI
jgi:hypothetical protein